MIRSSLIIALTLYSSVLIKGQTSHSSQSTTTPTINILDPFVGGVVDPRYKEQASLDLPPLPGEKQNRKTTKDNTVNKNKRGKAVTTVPIPTIAIDGEVKELNGENLAKYLSEPQTYAKDKFAQGKEQTYDASRYVKYKDSPCFEKIGYSSYYSDDDLQQRYQRCEQEYYKDLMTKVVLGLSLVGGVGLMIFLSLRKKAADDNRVQKDK